MKALCGNSNAIFFAKASLANLASLAKLSEADCQSPNVHFEGPNKKKRERLLLRRRPNGARRSAIELVRLLQFPMDTIESLPIQCRLYGAELYRGFQYGDPPEVLGQDMNGQRTSY